ncbi:flagellar biosynthetic protein FliR [Alphaproteobacteria bacterium]|nr:flagellar biosynthetic protein FliR [Alphaproteobacteria bacterium]
MGDAALSNLGGVGALPGLDLQFVMELLAGLFLASLRIGAFLISSPFFGGSAVPLQVRIIMAVLLGVAVVNNVTVPDWQSFTALTGIQVIMTELAIGIGSGLILTIWFSAVLIAGEKIASSAGLGFAAQIDPDSGGQTPVVSKTFSLFLTVIFLSWNGHLMVLRAVADSYEYLPVGAMPAFPLLIQGGIAAAGSMFLAATIIMLPNMKNPAPRPAPTRNRPPKTNPRIFKIPRLFLGWLFSSSAIDSSSNGRPYLIH